MSTVRDPWEVLMWWMAHPHEARRQMLRRAAYQIARSPVREEIERLLPEKCRLPFDELCDGLEDWTRS